MDLMKVVMLEPAMLNTWDAKLNFVTENWIKKANEKGFPGEAIVADIKTFTKMYTGQ